MAVFVHRSVSIFRELQFERSELAWCQYTFADPYSRWAFPNSPKIFRCLKTLNQKKKWLYKHLLSTLSFHLYPWNPQQLSSNFTYPALGGSPLGPSDCSENMRRDPPRKAPPVRLHAILGPKRTCWKGGWRLVLKLLLEDHEFQGKHGET